MVDKKISELTTAGTLTGTEVAPIVQSGVTVKAATLAIGGPAVAAHVAESDPHTQYLTELAAALAYQPLSANLTTWAGITPGSGVAAWLATPSSANLISAVTDETGSGALVFANTPTLVTPILGVAAATSINKVAITAPAASATLTIANGKTLTVGNTVTFTATDGSTLAIGGGGTLGTAAFQNTGTSGANLPFLNGNNTWSGTQILLAGSAIASASVGLLFNNTASDYLHTIDKDSTGVKFSVNNGSRGFRFDVNGNIYLSVSSAGLTTAYTFEVNGPSVSCAFKSTNNTWIAYYAYAGITGGYIGTDGSTGLALSNADFTVTLTLGASSAKLEDSNNQVAFDVRATHASLSSPMQTNIATRAASSAYSFFKGISGGSSGDTEFIFDGDGNARCDGAWTGGGADYAEYFEWADGNPTGEDRRGVSVVLDGSMIRPAQAGEDPLGVISGNPSIVGDAAWNKWSGKYERDDFGTYIVEDYVAVEWEETIIIPPPDEAPEGTEPTTRVDVRSYALDALPPGVWPPDGATQSMQKRRKLSPGYDPVTPYIPRAERREWDAVGLLGKLRVRKGQPTGARWIKMRDISETVEEWFIR